ncbi:hypothetical protein Leryth_012651 [Lithospermum erythrorhizon]|nr:hypothetical protein Leryth_012651 [Lithospermum erythrorhizon]
MVHYVQKESTNFNRGRGRFPRGIGRGNGSERRSYQVASGSNSVVDNSSKQRCFVCDSLMHLANSWPHRSSHPQANYVAHGVSNISIGHSYPEVHYSGSSHHGSPMQYNPWVPHTGTSHHITPDLAYASHVRVIPWGGSLAGCKWSTIKHCSHRIR